MNREEIKKKIKEKISLLKNERLDGLVLSLKNRNKNIYNSIIEETEYLGEECKFMERIYHITNDLKERPKCLICGKELLFIRYNDAYRKYCNKCSQKSEERNKKISESKLNMGEERKKKLYVDITKKRVPKYIKTWENKPLAEKIKIWDKQQKTRNDKSQEEKNIILEKNRRGVHKYQSKLTNEEVIKICDKIAQTRIKNGIHSSYAAYCGYYKEIYFQSLSELIFLIFCFDHNIKIERAKIISKYYNLIDDKNHRYYPDFYLPEVDQYIEIKGRVFPDDEIKWKTFPYKLDIYLDRSGKFKILKQYVVGKYGKCFYKEHIKKEL
jgi:hypothetical protein